MRFFFSLFQHLWLATTFRHKFEGIPSSKNSLFYFIVFLSSAVAFLRWESPVVILIHLVFLLVTTKYFSAQVALIVALSSIAVDIIAIPYMNFSGEKNHWILESYGWVNYFFYAAKHKFAEVKEELKN